MSSIAAPHDETLRAIAEPVRWRIVELLAAEELCVCHLVDELGVAQPLVSHHLRVLRDAGLVATSKHRYWTYYRLLPDGLAALARSIGQLAELPLTVDRRACC
jgi:ArsR family transcriptional regulator, arsenate/arsenite/antimonite-responsive transcriptional repressor